MERPMNNIYKAIEITAPGKEAIWSMEDCRLIRQVLLQAKQDKEDALNFAKELDAWLSFNNNPTSEQLSTMRKDLNKLIKQLSE